MDDTDFTYMMYMYWRWNWHVYDLTIALTFENFCQTHRVQVFSDTIFSSAKNLTRVPAVRLLRPPLSLSSTHSLSYTLLYSSFTILYHLVYFDVLLYHKTDNIRKSLDVYERSCLVLAVDVRSCLVLGLDVHGLAVFPRPLLHRVYTK